MFPLVDFFLMWLLWERISCDPQLYNKNLENVAHAKEPEDV